jgi:hypothetical protein
MSAFEGWLTKRGDIVKSWRRRFFVLDKATGTLRYYTGADKAESGLKGTVPIRGAAVAPLTKRDIDCDFCFGLRPKGSKRVYILAGDTAAARDEWIGQLAAAGALAPPGARTRAAAATQRSSLTPTARQARAPRSPRSGRGSALAPRPRRSSPA